MKKILLTVFVVALIPLNSCKENVTEKINQENIEKAAERDAQTIVFPSINFDKTLHDFGEIQKDNLYRIHCFWWNSRGGPLQNTLVLKKFQGIPLAEYAGLGEILKDTFCRIH